MQDFYPGDPASHVLGRPDEKPARRHAPPKPKPRVRILEFEERLLRDIRQRRMEIEPLVKEVPELEKALESLKTI
jgi:hypothetical protein